MKSLRAFSARGHRFRLLGTFFCGLGIYMSRLLALLAFISVSSASASTESVQIDLSLRWSVLENVFSKEYPQGRSKVQLSLSNQGRSTLPQEGWSLYFTAIAGVDLTSAQGPFKLTHASGTLFRIQPQDGFPSLKPNESYQFVFFQPEVMLKLAKAPTGPYLVFDQKPQQAVAIPDYQLTLPSQPQQVAINALGDSGLFTLEQQFQRNAKISPLNADALPPIFPRPQLAQRLPGLVTWHHMPNMMADRALQSQVKSIEKILQPYLAKKQRRASEPSVQLRLAPLSFSDSPEAYVLTIDPKLGVVIQGASAAGVARGVQSFRELLPLRNTSALGLTLDAWYIQDAPRFAHRGLLLDVARNFQSKDNVMRLLDLMARYKLNKFHFHLTDDEGWRIEIQGLPELTRFGARRGHGTATMSHLSPAYGSGPSLTDPHGSGHYTAADYIQILKHAQALHIEVIPEIEMPGHSRAAVLAMRHRYERLKLSDPIKAQAFLLNDAADLSKYRSAQNYSDNVMDPGLASTYRFIDHVVNHMQLLHAKAGVPLRVLHVGADELPAGAWHKSPAVAQLMQEKQITDFKGVWNVFYDQVHQMLAHRGIQVAGWEELGAQRENLGAVDKMMPNPHFLNRKFSLYVWNNLDDSADLAHRLANAGYQTVLAPATALYFDMSHNANPQEPGVNWARYVDMQKVFDFDPLDITRESPFDPSVLDRPSVNLEALTSEGQKNIAGIQGTLFSETITSQAIMDSLLMPRMLALAERAWAAPVALDRQSAASLASSHAIAWSVFVHQLGLKVLPKLDQELKGVAYRLAPPGVRIQKGLVHVNHELPGVQIRYTTDGAAPVVRSPLVMGPLPYSASLKFAAFAANGRASRAVSLEAP